MENIVIHCPTQELCNQVTETLNGDIKGSIFTKGGYKEDIHINISGNEYCSGKWYREHGYTIIEAEDWLASRAPAYLLND